MQIRSNVCAEQAEEGRDRKCLVTITNHFKVDAVAVVVDGKEGDGGVHRDHEEDTDDVPLLPWFQIVRGVHEYEQEGDQDGDDGEYCPDPEPQTVESVVMPYRVFANCHVLQGGVTYWPTHAGARVRVWSLRQSSMVEASDGVRRSFASHITVVGLGKRELLWRQALSRNDIGEGDFGGFVKGRARTLWTAARSRARQADGGVPAVLLARVNCIEGSKKCVRTGRTRTADKLVD